MAFYVKSIWKLRSVTCHVRSVTQCYLPPDTGESASSQL